MPDVFLSYAREDRERARVLARALESHGWSVWWDRKLVAGEAFDETIERQLATANSVVVLWSEHSISSEWVRNEASAASERDVLVPVLLDDVKQPLEFRRRHAADLTHWTGDPTEGEFLGLIAGIAAKTGRPTRQPPIPPVERMRQRIRPLPAIATLTIASVGGYGMWMLTSNGASVDNLGVDRLAVVDVASSEGRDIDNPSTLGLGTIQKISLEANQEYYVRLSESAESLKVVLDMKRADNRRSNLQSRLSVLNQDGTVAEDSLINFNELDTGARKTASSSTRQAAIIGFKLRNGSAPADFWLSVRQEPAPQFIPFFANIAPQPMKLGEGASGLLGPDEDAYYMTSLGQGDYRIIIDFANAERRNTNIGGSVALLDGDGGNYREIVRFSEIDVSYRKIGTFLVRNDGPVILKVQNIHDTVRYTVRLAQAGSERPDVGPTSR
ncbi:MAG: toll/interleukin-1 receptor domain-containing protein [Vicinamibacterales bacterium]